MRTPRGRLRLALGAFLLGCCGVWVSRMPRLGTRLTLYRKHTLEFEENMHFLKNKTENNLQELMKTLTIMYNESPQREDLPVNSAMKNILDNTFVPNTYVPNTFEVLKLFFPHLRKVGKIYPDVIVGKERAGVSFALGIPTVKRGDHGYLKQTLTSLISRMTLSEQKDSVVIVSIADSNEDYFKSVVNMITKKFKQQLKSGSLEVISIPALFYPSMLHAMPSTQDSHKVERWRIKQVVDFCFLMLYAQPKARYYLQLEDDIIAKKMYLTKITDFVHNISSNNWLYIEFSVLGFIDKPIDLLLGDIFQVKMCHPGETPEKCSEQNKQIRIQYKPSLFQHVGIQSSLPGKEQYLKTTEFQMKKNSASFLLVILEFFIIFGNNGPFSRLRTLVG